MKKLWKVVWRILFILVILLRMIASFVAIFSKEISTTALIIETLLTIIGLILIFWCIQSLIALSKNKALESKISEKMLRICNHTCWKVFICIFGSVGGISGMIASILQIFSGKQSIFMAVRDIVLMILCFVVFFGSVDELIILFKNKSLRK
jgi:hypothetical protein